MNSRDRAAMDFQTQLKVNSTFSTKMGDCTDEKATEGLSATNVVHIGIWPRTGRLAKKNSKFLVRDEPSRLLDRLKGDL